MNYFLVTTSIFNTTEEKYIIRKEQYITAINKLKEQLKKSDTEYKIIIIENNGPRKTYLDNLGCEVFYTENNFLPVNNNGYKELKDVFDCINHYNINDDDFVTKMTGRYQIEENSEYIKTVLNLHNQSYDCVIKYGSFDSPVDYKCDDCITGLLGMRCVYIKQIQFPETRNPVEWDWAKATKSINDDKIYKVDKLGILICPGSDNYFRV